MSNIRNLEKFNTHSMSKDVVLKVSTGRDFLIENISKIIDENISQPKTIQHIILTGPRGMGKSFLLKYFQITSKNRAKKLGTIDFVLLPEEQYNINTPSQFIDELLASTEKNNTQSISAVWNKKDDNWESSLEKLRKRIEEKTNKHKDYLLIAAVENFDVMIETVFPTNADQSKLRKFLTSTPNFMLLGSSKKNDIDKDYNKRLFFTFQKYSLTPWTESDYTKYFNRRYNLLKQIQPNSFKEKDVNQLRNKLKAISKFTGGSPRMAVVLTNLLFDEDAVSTAQTLDNVVEDLSPYYQDLMEKMPQNSRILFDALIRSEENISQSALAELVGAKQSDISKAFKWLQENNFIVGIKIKGEKFYRYSIADRVFVLFYQKRFLLLGLECSYIKILSDFLISFYEAKELGEYSLKYMSKNYSEGIEFAKLTFIKEKINLDSIDWNDTSKIKAKLNDIINGNTKSSIAKTGLPKLKERTKEEIEKEIKSNLNAIKRYEKENDTSALLTELFEIAFNYQEIEQFENSTKYFSEIVEFMNTLEGDYLQAMSLDQIGWNYNNLNQFEKSTDFYKKAFVLFKKENSISEQAQCQRGIGANHYALEQFEKSIEFCKKAQILYKQDKNITEQALMSALIGICYQNLNKFESAINSHKKALALHKKEGDVSGQANNFAIIGSNYKELKRFTEAIKYYKKALSVSIENDDISWHSSNLGQIGVNYLLNNKFEKAWEIVLQQVNTKVKPEEIIKHFGDAIVYKERWEGKAEAFNIAIQILSTLNEIPTNINKYVALKNIFANMLNMDLPFDLLEDICAEAKNIFGKKENIIIDATIHTIKYLESGKDETYLKRINPDMAIAIKAIIKEAKL